MLIRSNFLQGVGHHKNLMIFSDTHSLQLTTERENRSIYLENVIAFPGLVNSHDHLEFNLFPLLINRTYTSQEEWGHDIHSTQQELIDNVLKIPLDLRIKWGLLKNLINGALFVVHHGGHHSLVRKASSYPVYLDYQYLHSLPAEPLWKIKLNSPLGNEVMLHIGEGIGSIYEAQIDKLLKWNLFNRELIGVHGISMREEQAKKFKAIIWCPDSNLRLYGKTASINKLKASTIVLFGTDSSISSDSNLWEQLRMARNLDMLTDEELFEALTDNPFQVFNPFKVPSLIVARKGNKSGWESFYSLEPQDLLLVVLKNKILMADRSVFKDMPVDQYQLLGVSQSEKWVISKLANVVGVLEKLGVKLPLNVQSIT
jgi:hypothetical protein